MLILPKTDYNQRGVAINSASIITNDFDDPIADGIISDFPVTDWTISDVFLTKLMEKTYWAALAVR